MNRKHYKALALVLGVTAWTPSSAGIFGSIKNAASRAGKGILAAGEGALSLGEEAAKQIFNRPKYKVVNGVIQKPLLKPWHERPLTKIEKFSQWMGKNF